MSLTSLPCDIWVLLQNDPVIDEIWSIIMEFFEGDAWKAIAWYRADNPLLGSQSPASMIIIGRKEKLLKFVRNKLKGVQP